ncbi:restriction endonuclease subunit S [Fibrobacter sp.]|uniref:restriction endonuclease subunit S n=1 Tax=Fibrobacter sp. TaxID=35828 RepID=UPI00388E7A98
MSKIDDLLKKYCPNGVEVGTLGELGEFYGGLTGKSKEDFKDGNAKFITYMNVYSNLKLNLKTDEKVKISDGEKQHTIEYGDILFTGSSETPDECGMSSVLCDITSEKLYLNSFSFGFRFFDKKLFEPEFTKYLFRSNDLRKQIIKTASGVTRFNVSKERMKKVVIPIPPIEVQKEIAHILDSFTELTAELTAELSARKKQYAYYRDELLTFENDVSVITKTIGEISLFRRGSFPQPYGKAEWYDGDGAMPFVQVADIGEDMRLVDDTKRKISKVAQPKSVFAPKGSIIISLQGSIGRIAVTQFDAYIDRTVAIFQDISKELHPKYFVYQLQRVFAQKEKTARGGTIKTITKEEFTEFPIDIPPFAVQQRIVNILDNFDAICSDLQSGLPAEIEARKKQYEYYRDKLLSFQPLT